MIALVLLAALSSTSMTPEQEVEAWDPIHDGRDPAVAAEHVDEAPNDNGSQAFDAAGHLVAGVGVGLGVGAAAGLGTAYAINNAVGAWVGAGVFLFCVAAGPAALLLALDDLPLWAPFVAGPAVVVGGVVGGIVGVGAAFLAAVAVIPRGSDCIGCGPEGLLLFAIPPVTAAIGAITAGVATTTIASFAE